MSNIIEIRMKDGDSFLVDLDKWNYAKLNRGVWLAMKLQPEICGIIPEERIEEIIDHRKKGGEQDESI